MRILLLQLIHVSCTVSHDWIIPLVPYPGNTVAAYFEVIGTRPSILLIILRCLRQTGTFDAAFIHSRIRADIPSLGGTDEALSTRIDRYKCLLTHISRVPVWLHEVLQEHYPGLPTLATIKRAAPADYPEVLFPAMRSIARGWGLFCISRLSSDLDFCSYSPSKYIHGKLQSGYSLTKAGLSNMLSVLYTEELEKTRMPVPDFDISMNPFSPVKERTMLHYFFSK